MNKNIVFKKFYNKGVKNSFPAPPPPKKNKTKKTQQQQQTNKSRTLKNIHLYTCKWYANSLAKIQVKCDFSNVSRYIRSYGFVLSKFIKLVVWWKHFDVPLWAQNLWKRTCTEKFVIEFFSRSTAKSSPMRDSITLKILFIPIYHTRTVQIAKYDQSPL